MLWQQSKGQQRLCTSWWRHQMETVSALLAICAGNSPVTGEFPAQRPVTWSFDVFFDLRPNKRLSKQSWGWWFEAPFRPLWRHRNVSWDIELDNKALSQYKDRLSRYMDRIIKLRRSWNRLTGKRLICTMRIHMLERRCLYIWRSPWLLHDSDIFLLILNPSITAPMHIYGTGTWPCNRPNTNRGFGSVPQTICGLIIESSWKFPLLLL